MNISRWLLIVAMALLTPLAARAADDVGKNMPPDAMLIVSIRNVNAVLEQGKKTAIYGLYKDPAMAKVVEPLEKKFREKFDKKLAEAWRTSGIENPPEDFPWPTGNVTLVLRAELKTKHIKVPRYDPEAADDAPMTTDDKLITTFDPQVLVIADFGEKGEQATKLIDQLLEKETDKGGRIDKDTVSGVAVRTLTPASAKDAGEDAADIERTVLAWRKNVLLVGNSSRLMADVLARMAGAGLDTLADSEDYKSAMKRIDGATADMSVYLRLDTLINSAMQSAGADDAKSAATALEASGLRGVKAVAAGMKLAPTPQEDSHAKLFISVPDKPKGFLAAFFGGTTPTKPSKLLTADVSGLFVSRVDFGAFYDAIGEMMTAVGSGSLDESLSMALQATAGEGDGENARPAVDARKDVVGNLSGPFTVTVQSYKNEEGKTAKSVLLAIGAKDAAALDAAIGRIHSTFIARDNKELQRDLRNVKLYLLPFNPFAELEAGGTRGADARKCALAIVGDNLVLGSVPSVEQAVRDNKAEVRSISTDPFYAAAAKLLPAQVAFYGYSNGQKSMREQWEELKARAKPGAEGEEPASHNPGNPFEELLSGIDWSQLPEWSAVSKYFGPGVVWMAPTDGGLMLEWVELRAPKE